jgi:GT2 family glycosyltransferase
MRTSVIISTYNKVPWLERTLWGYEAQTRRDFDIVIADDGSGPETRELIARVQRESELKISHVWQEDRGFRKCEILNRAILSTDAEYIIFADGDCVPRADLVEKHLRLARPLHYVSATVIRVDEELGLAFTRDDIVSGRFADRNWLRSRGHRGGRRDVRLRNAPALLRLLDAFTTTPCHFDGGNVSVWRSGLQIVNGFEMEMGYGWEDRAVGIRLRHAGYRGIQARNRIVAMHIDHARPHRVAAEMERNRAIRDRIVRGREVRARLGLDELGDTSAVPGGSPAEG